MKLFRKDKLPKITVSYSDGLGRQVAKERLRPGDSIEIRPKKDDPVALRIHYDDYDGVLKYHQLLPHLVLDDDSIRWAHIEYVVRGLN